jgi:hypothetical protein
MKKTTSTLPLTPSEIDRLLTLNQRLAKLERYLLDEAQRLEPPLQRRVADPQDAMNDYEIEAELHYSLRASDPDFDEDEDNVMTERAYTLKNLRKDTELCDGFDWREPGTLSELDQAPHCRLFHELYDHGYGKARRTLSLRDCSRVGSVWVIISVEHQADLDIDQDKWLAMDDY